MAGSEQRPTDDVEGHARYRQDAEAVNEDKVAGDDVEGHVAKCKEDTEAIDDVAGHVWKCKEDTEAVDDTEGHGVKFRPKDTLPSHDVQGHGAKYGGLDAEAIDEDAADVEGHVVKCREDAEAIDEVAGHVMQAQGGHRGD